MAYTITSSNGTIVNSLLTDAATLHLAIAGISGAPPTVNAYVLDANQKKAGIVHFPNGNQVTNNDTLDVIPVCFQSGPLTLHIEDQASGDAGDLAITAVVSTDVRFASAPGNVVTALPNGVIITARITNDAQVQQPGALSLTYESDALESNGFFGPPTLQTTTPGNDQSFAYTTKAVTKADLTKVGIQFKLEIGPANAQVAVEDLIPFRVAEAPSFPITDGGVITDTLIDGMPPQGLPVNIPAITDAYGFTSVALYAHPIPGTAIWAAGEDAEPDAYTVNPKKDKLIAYGYVTVDTGASTLFLTATNRWFGMGNQTYDVYYVVTKPDKNQNVSQGVKIPMDLVRHSNTSTINPDLRPPIPNIPQYTAAEYDAADKLIITVPFDGKVTPQAGDKIKPCLDLTGISLINEGQFIHLELGEYELTDADIINGKAFIVYGDDSGTLASWHQADMTQIEPTQGDLYYTYQSAVDLTTARSPSRSFWVDTVSPHSRGRPYILDLTERLRQLQP